MLLDHSTASVILGLAITAKAHYTLQFPAPIGPYDDAKLINGPCDGIDPTTTTEFQDWPWRGEAVTVITTHPVVKWDFNVALFSSVANAQSSFIPLAETMEQRNGTGYLCFGQVPGRKEWVGQKVIIQLIQHAPDGDLTTCLGAIFTDSAPDLTGSGNCKNDSGIAKKPFDIFWLPGTGSDLNSAATISSSLSPASPTTSIGTLESTDTSTTASTTSGAVVGSETVVSSGTVTTSRTTKSTTISPSPTTSKPAAVTTTSTGVTSTPSPSSFTGGSDKTSVGSLLGFGSLLFAAIMMVELQNLVFLA